MAFCVLAGVSDFGILLQENRNRLDSMLTKRKWFVIIITYGTISDFNACILLAGNDLQGKWGTKRSVDEHEFETEIRLYF